MKRKYILALFAMFILSVNAQEVLTLQMCRELALKNNKDMASAELQTKYAHYTMKSYWGNFFPNFTAHGMGIYSTADGELKVPGGNLPVMKPVASGQFVPTGEFAYFPGLALNYDINTIYGVGISVEQPIYMGGKIIAAYRMSKKGKELARLNEDLTTSEVILATDNAYVLLVKAQELKKVADSYNQVLQELKKNVDSAYKHGLKSQNDVLKVQVKLNESELAIRKAENAIRLASMNLCHYIGHPLINHIEVTNDMPEMAMGMYADANDITARPEYEMLNKKVEIAKQQVKLSRSEMLPKIGIKGSYDYAHGMKVMDENFFDQAGFNVMLNVSLPIFHFGERYNKVRASKVKLQQARLEQTNINEKMLLELTQASNNLEEARLEAELSDRSLQQAEENMKVSKGHYNSGLESLSDHLEAQALWQKAYATKIDTYFQLYLTYIKYLKASGRLK